MDGLESLEKAREVERHLAAVWSDELRALGVQPGAWLLVRADLRGLRPRGIQPGCKPDLAQAMLDALLHAVGEDGLLVMPTFTSSYFAGMGWFRGNRKKTMDARTAPYTGVLPVAFLKRAGVMRSTHPTNSFAALGPAAFNLMRFHDAYSASFRPVEDLVNAPQGQMLLLGCVTSSPGFSTTHLAELHLGLSHDTPLSRRLLVRYTDSYGEPRVFRKADIPGCSRAYDRLYANYRELEVSREGKVGGAHSMLVSAGAVYDVDYAALLADRYLLICDKPICLHCMLSGAASTRRRLAFANAAARQVAYKLKSRMYKLNMSRFRT